MMPAFLCDASQPNFNYYGRWQPGPTAISINSGALVEFAYAGSSCELVFAVDEFAPAIFRQVDHGPVARIALSAKAPTVPVTVAAGHHFVRFWIATHSLYLTSAAG